MAGQREPVPKAGAPGAVSSRMDAVPTRGPSYRMATAVHTARPAMAGHEG